MVLKGALCPLLHYGVFVAMTLCFVLQEVSTCPSLLKSNLLGKQYINSLQIGVPGGLSW